MIKVTEITYNTKSGANIKVKVTRRYGNEIQQVWIDQYVDRTVFVDECKIEVSVNGAEYKSCDLTIASGYNVLRYSDIREHKIYNVVVPDDKLEEIESLMSERLTEEVSHEEEEEVEMVKNAVKQGRVLPKSELLQKRVEYKEGMLEGGEGYNPYDYYITTEYLNKFRKKHPNLNV